MSVIGLRAPRRAVRGGFHREVEYELTVSISADEKMLEWTFAVDYLEAGESSGEGRVPIATRVEAAFTAADHAAR